MCVTSRVPPLGDLVHNPGMCPDWESNWWPLSCRPALNPLNHTSQSSFLPLIFFFWGCVKKETLCSSVVIQLSCEAALAAGSSPARQLYCAAQWSALLCSGLLSAVPVCSAVLWSAPFLASLPWPGLWSCQISPKFQLRQENMVFSHWWKGKVCSSRNGF